MKIYKEREEKEYSIEYKVYQVYCEERRYVYSEIKVEQ